MLVLSAFRCAGDIQGRLLQPAAASTPIRTFSKTVMSGKISVIWKVRTIPLCTRSTVESRLILRS